MLTGSRFSSTAWNANQSTKVCPYISSAASRATFFKAGCSCEIQERMISLCETSVSHKPQRKPRCPKTLGSSCDVENVNKGFILVFFLAKARASFFVFAETLHPMTPLISSRFERDTPTSVRLTDSSSYHSYTTFTPIYASLMFSGQKSTLKQSQTWTSQLMDAGLALSTWLLFFS